MDLIRSRSLRRARGEYRSFEHVRPGVCHLFTIPDKGEGVHDRQSILFQEDIEILVAGLTGIDCVLSGCAVSAQGSPDMTLAVAKGAVLSNGSLFAVTAGNVTITTADSSNPRIDLVVVNSSGTKAVRAGTAAANPKPPVRNSNDVVLAMVYVPASDTAIESGQIVDKRVQRGGTAGGGGAPIVIKKDTTVFSANNTTAAQTVFTVTLPSGLFNAGQVIRLTLWGNYLANSGTPTFTFTFAYGGTNLFVDATAATTADADRGAWRVELEIVAQANNDQALNGYVMFQTPAAKTAPTTGGQGDLAVTTSVAAPFAGAAGTVDSDAADRTLVVQVTMNVANAANEIVREGSICELI